MMNKFKSSNNINITYLATKFVDELAIWHAPSYLSAFGKECVVNSFSCQSDGNIEIPIKTEIESFEINLYFGLTNFQIQLLTKNRMWDDHKLISDKTNEPYGSIVLRNKLKTQLITVGDIFKMYYYFNKDTAQKDLIWKTLKKTLNSDTYDNKHENILGQAEGGNIYFINEKNNNNHTLESLCKSKIIINNEIGSQIYYLLKWRSPNIEKITQIIETISDYAIKLIKYYLYHEPLDHCMVVQDCVLKFEEPKSLPNILKELGEQATNNKIKHHYLKYYFKLTKQLSHPQQAVLDEQYPPFVLKKQIQLNGYPIFAMRNIYYSEWNSSDFTNFECGFIEKNDLIKYDKYKYQYHTFGKHLHTHTDLLKSNGFPYICHKKELKISNFIKDEIKSINIEKYDLEKYYQDHENDFDEPEIDTDFSLNITLDEYNELVILEKQCKEEHDKIKREYEIL
jgi:hypothetical protein